MTLRQRQVLFAQLLARLIQQAGAMGYEVTLGECWRSPAEAARLAGTGAGIARSLHCDRLAVDLNLFWEGAFLTQTEQYAKLGAWWKAQHPDCRWGGDFHARPDGNHYSLTYLGRA